VKQESTFSCATIQENTMKKSANEKTNFQKLLIAASKWIFFTVRLILIFYVGLSAQKILSAEVASKKNVHIHFEEYVKRIQANLPEIQQSLLQVEKSRNTLMASQAAHDFNLQSNGQYSVQQQYSTNPLFQNQVTTGIAGDISLSKKLQKSGTTITAGYDYQHISSIVKMDSQETRLAYHSPAVFVNISQPILRNAFGLLDRYSIRDAAMKLEIEKLRQQETDKQTMTAYKKLFFDWIEIGLRLELIKKNIANAEILYHQVRSRRLAGMADIDDELSARLVVLNYRDTYKDNEINLNQIARQLEVHLKKNRSTEKMQPDTDDFNRYYQSAGTQAYPFVNYEQTRSFALYQKMLENYQSGEIAAKNRLLPNLNIIGEYALKSRNDSYTEAMNRLNDPHYYIGFSFTYPLDNTQAKADLNSARIQIEDVIQQRQISRNSYEKTLGTLLEAIHGLQEFIKMKEAKIKTLQQLYQTEWIKYRQARLDIKYLIDTMNSIITEELAIVSFKKSLIQYNFDYQALVD